MKAEEINYQIEAMALNKIDEESVEQSSSDKSSDCIEEGDKKENYLSDDDQDIQLSGDNEPAVSNDLDDKDKAEDIRSQNSANLSDIDNGR